MLHIYGREIPNLQVTSETDKYLYIDIDNADLGNFAALELPPTATYIITLRQLKDYDMYLKQGYYNILHVGRASEITEALINRFIQQDYNDNFLKNVSQRISDLYISTGSVISDISKALAALRDDDAQTFIDIMSHNVDNFLNALSDINTMSMFCKSVQSAKQTYTDALQQATRLESALADLEQANSRYEATHAENALLIAERDELKTTIEGLNAQINARTITSTEIINSAEYISLSARLETVTAERNEIKQEFENYKLDMQSETAAADSSGLMDLNRQLREDIRKLKERKPSDSVAEKLPIFTDTTNLAAETVICFREIRPAVYMNSLITWLNSSLRMYSRVKGKSFLILVVDPLTSHYDEMKYVKHGWSVNKLVSDMTVLVVPPMRFDVLKSTYHIEEYDVLICIDRCRVTTPVVEMKSAKTFYLINTCGDIADYQLDGMRCIAFMDKVPAGASKTADATPKYHIPPWSDALCTNEITQRAGKHVQDGVFINILKECGVYWQ